MKVAGSDERIVDLTRWNRSGLDRFRYIDGAAAEWVEYLRVCHLLLYANTSDLGATLPDDPEIWMQAFVSGRFPDGRPVVDVANQLRSTWQRSGFDGQFPIDATYEEILRSQYDFLALDQTTQLSRAFARSFHLLTESLNAYANEGFLATATQDLFLRRLLEMVNFTPLPAASAVVPVAVLLEDGVEEKVLGSDLGFEYNPGNGDPLLTFENLESVTAHSSLNLLRPADWDKRIDLIANDESKFAVENEAIFSLPLIGSYGILRQAGRVEAILIKEASKAHKYVKVKRSVNKIHASLQEAELHVGPKFSLQARPQGSSWLHFLAAPVVWVGQKVALKTERQGRDPRNPGGPVVSINATVLATVMEVRGRDVRLNRTKPAGLVGVYPVVPKIVVANPGHDPSVPDILERDGLKIPEGSLAVGDLEPLDTQLVHFEGAPPDEFVVGARVAVVLSGGRSQGARLVSVDADESGFSAKLNGPVLSRSVRELHGDFASNSTLLHTKRSSTPLFSGGRIYLDTTVLNASTNGSALFKSGRSLLIATDPEVDRLPIAASVTVDSFGVTGLGGLWFTLVEDVSALAGLQRGDAVIYGNVVPCGHGKSLPPRVLGSGDNALLGQTMRIEDAPLATRPDSNFPGGVSNDIEISIEGRKWSQVVSADVAGDAPSYSISIEDDGSHKITFHQRLPSATDNVLLDKIRVGAGSQANEIDPFKVRAPKPKVAGVKALVQPLSPQFGEDVQDVTALRKQGGSHFALADRALAVADFAVLAESHAGVWHASATSRRVAALGTRTVIDLTIVPSGGGAIAGVVEDLKQYLLDRSLPDTSLLIKPFHPAAFGGSAVLNVKTAYEQSQSIIDEVKATLADRFSLQNRPLGKNLFVTELVAAAEEHEAVQNLTFVLRPLWAGSKPKVVRASSGALQAVVPDDTFAVFLEDVDVIDFSFGGGDRDVF